MSAGGYPAESVLSVQPGEAFSQRLVRFGDEHERLFVASSHVQPRPISVRTRSVIFCQESVITKQALLPPKPTITASITRLHT